MGCGCINSRGGSHVSSGIRWVGDECESALCSSHVYIDDGLLCKRDDRYLEAMLSGRFGMGWPRASVRSVKVAMQQASQPASQARHTQPRRSSCLATALAPHRCHAPNPNSAPSFRWACPGLAASIKRLKGKRACWGLRNTPSAVHACPQTLCAPGPAHSWPPAPSRLLHLPCPPCSSVCAGRLNPAETVALP